MSRPDLPDNTPVLVGAGQIVEREATGHSHMTLAAQAAINAIADTGGTGIADQIDTIWVTRLFSDMGHLWPCKWGRSNNPPESVARAIGASPAERIYSVTGGNAPQSAVIEFARDIAKGTRSVVLLAGAEALKNQRHAERNQQPLNWEENYDVPLEDRGMGDSVATPQELQNGLTNVAYYYALIDQAQRHKSGRSVTEHQKFMATMLASLSAVAADNPYAQFPGSQSAQEILGAAPMTHLYTKRMIAQDGVNQGAALLLCSLGKAREMSIPESKLVYLHGMAQGIEVPLSCRPDPAQSLVANRVVEHALTMAGRSASEIDLLDIYSCFPCAITAIAEPLGLPVDGSKSLTLTGGLPYFGGPGNNYSMHALAEALWQCREHPDSYAMISCNGGVLSKQATGIYSHQPSSIDWAAAHTSIATEDLPVRDICDNPTTGIIVSYTVHYDRDGGTHAIVLGDTADNERFVAITAEEDRDTPNAMLAEDPTGKRVSVSPPQDGRLNFTLETKA